MSLSLPLPSAAQTGSALEAAAPPTFTHYFFDAPTVKITPSGDYERIKGSAGKAIAVSVSDPRVEVSGTIRIKSGSQFLKMGDVIKPIDSSGSPWYNIYFTVKASDGGDLISGRPAMQTVTLEHNPLVDHSGSTNVDA